MKASYEVIHHDKRSFLARGFTAAGFEAPYHFHEEYELTFITRGHGKRYVGSHMENFADHDLILIGPNLPHCWKLDGQQDDATSIVIQFGADFLGDAFFNRYELRDIHLLLQKSKSGISFMPNEQSVVCKKMKQLKEEPDDFTRLLQLLDVLQQLALNSDYKLLDLDSSIAHIGMNEQQRINPVFAYLVDNFRGEVSLDEAADIAHMTPNAFCKYFKKITRKTFIETIIEYRLNYATQQLVQTDKPVASIAFESGFGDVSHFYKTFKSKMGMSPLHYRKTFIH